MPTALFICTGNICRSPMAEYLFRERTAALNWDAGSRGLFAANGAPASLEAVQALGELHIDLRPHRSRMLSETDINEADIILCMTAMHVQEIKRRLPGRSGKLHRLTAFSEGALPEDVPDPIGQPLSVYRAVRDLIDQALANVILHLRETPPWNQQV